MPSLACHGEYAYPSGRLLRAFLDVLLATCSTLEGIQIGQSAKPSRLANELHRTSAMKATRRWRRCGVFDAIGIHDTSTHQSASGAGRLI